MQKPKHKRRKRDNARSDQGLADFPSKLPDGVRLVSITVVYEPMSDPSVPPELEPQIDELRELSVNSPTKALARIDMLLKEFPEARPLHNFRQVAYAELGSRTKVEQLIEEDFQKFPEYLFARVAYAQLLVRHKRFEEFDRLFPNGLEPKALYPERERFHVTEVLGVYAVAALNLIGRGKIDAAYSMLDVLRQVDEDSMQVDVVESGIEMAILKKRASRLLSSL